MVDLSDSSDSKTRQDRKYTGTGLGNAKNSSGLFRISGPERRVQRKRTVELDPRSRARPPAPGWAARRVISSTQPRQKSRRAMTRAMPFFRSPGGMGQRQSAQGTRVPERPKRRRSQDPRPIRTPVITYP